jgi:hypothetical protein
VTIWKAAERGTLGKGRLIQSGIEEAAAAAKESFFRWVFNARGISSRTRTDHAAATAAARLAAFCDAASQLDSITA